MAKERTIPDDWWPEWMQDLASEDPLGSDPVVVAAIEATDAEHQRYRKLFTALAPVDTLDDLLAHPGGIGFEASSNGPHPSYSDDKWEYEPRFWVHGTEVVPKLEPLVVRWESGSQTVLRPDQGFLMTYGLVPRLVTSGAGYVEHWDDVEEPRPDVVVVRPVSTRDVPCHTGASVAVAEDWLQDYATIRKMALVQVYYVQRRGNPTSELDAILGDKDIRVFKVPGRLIDVRKVDDGQILAQVWGVRPLLTPGTAPISAGQWDYKTLEWPGLSQPIGYDDATKLGPLDAVYVRDSVLGVYEGHPEYSIDPESGAVSYGNQWCVAWTRRVGRDLIAVEPKKLYEASRPNTVRHWHDHSVPRPPPAVQAVSENVGTRAKRMTYALAALGEVLAAIASHLQMSRPAAADFVHLDRGQLDYEGWWTGRAVEPITRHIPNELTQDEFLGRCSTLYQLVGEGLSVRRLRSLLEGLGVASDSIGDLGSIKLLGCLTGLAERSVKTGLALNSQSLHDSVTQPISSPALDRLIALNELRQLSDHRAGSDAKTKLIDALDAFGLDPASFGGGWGLALDGIYDGIAETLEMVAATLSQATSLSS